MSWLLARISSIAESALGVTALPVAINSNSRAISLGVVTPSPYLTELSTATLAIRKKTFECTFVCGSPSASIFCHTRRMTTLSNSRLVAVLSLRMLINTAASRTLSVICGCMNCRTPDPGT